MQIYKEQNKSYLYVFDYEFNNDVLEFCRKLRDKYGSNNFGWIDRRWRFTLLEIINDIKNTYPNVRIEANMYDDLLRFEIDKKQKELTTNTTEQIKNKKISNIILRDYQKEAISKILWAKKNLSIGNDLVVLPTGSGKSIILANLAYQINEPILILQPNKEILEQNLDKLLKYIDRSEIGIYSASMGEKIIKKFTLATIGSIYKKPEYFRHFKLVILDECNLLNIKNLSGMFTCFLKGINYPKIIGLTATPYRMDSIYLNWGTNQCRVAATIKLINRTKGLFWSRVLFNIHIQDLMDKGYLCPLEYIDLSLVEQEDLPLNKSQTDFDLEKYEDIISKKQEKILKVINYAQSISKSVLVFCSSVKQAEVLKTFISNSEVVTAKTKKDNRDNIIKRFRNGKIKVIFNVGIFTIGFDYPALDCIVLLRPMHSVGLYTQILGRGVRIAEGKKSCKIIDLTSTVKNIGKFESIKFIKREKWELESEINGQIKSWHNRELYSYIIDKKKKEQPVLLIT